MKPLPDKLSALIRIALHDENEAHKSKDYRIQMASWHTTDTDTGQCTVCLAGAVMAFSLGVVKGVDASPSSILHRPEARKLTSLDEVRKGNMIEALTIFLNRKEPWFAVDDRTVATLVWKTARRDGMGRIPSYYKHRAEWRKWLYKAANRLEALNY